MTTGFTDDAGDGAINDDPAGDGRAVDGTVDADATGLGSVRDHVLDDSAVQDDALDDGVLGGGDPFSEVVVIEKGFASGVTGECVECVLRLLEVGGVGNRCRA